jgi:hypothetical protein
MDKFHNAKFINKIEQQCVFYLFRSFDGIKIVRSQFQDKLQFPGCRKTFQLIVPRPLGSLKLGASPPVNQPETYQATAVG